MATLILAFANNETDHLTTLKKESKGVSDALRDRLARKEFVAIPESMATREFIINTIRAHESDLCLFLFSGHAGRDNLLFEDGNANAEGIARMLGRCKNLKLVILNGCSTAGQVKALLSQGVPAVIATSSPVGDEKATHFSIAFFNELARYNLSVKEAFERAIESTKVIGTIEKVEITRGFSIQEKNESSLWGLFYKKETSIHWHLPKDNTNKYPAPIRPLNWAIISGLVSVAFILTTFLFVNYYKELNQINASNYYFLLLIAAIIPSAFLFGAFKTTAKYSGKIMGGKLELSGVAALYFCLIGVGMANKPQKDQPLSLTVNVFSSEDSTEIIMNGEAKIMYGQAFIRKQINEGQFTFKEIPGEFNHDSLSLVVNAKGYFSKREKVYISGDRPVSEIYLKKMPISVKVKGTVTDKKGKPVDKAILVFGDGIGLDTSDVMGTFSITLPLENGSETNLRVYSGSNVPQYNGSITLSDKGSLSIQLR